MAKFLKKSHLAGVAGAAFSLAAFQPALAQTGPEPQSGPTTTTTDDQPVTTDDTVVIVGQRAMMQNAISRQRSSDTVDSVVTRDAIGQFPDQNVAEAVRRLPGVNVLDDQGEGRFISVRGLDPSLNAASINGVRMPSPEADTRQVALDVVSSELVESIEVKKTLTPDMDADTIGASIEINTTKAFARPNTFVSGTLEGSYNDLNGKTSPKGSVDFSVPIAPNFGIAGGLSYNKRKTSTDNQEMAGWNLSTRAASQGVAYANTVEYRDYDVERERLGGSLSADWRVDEATVLYARALYSKFDDTELRRRLVFALQGTPVSGDANSATFMSSTSAGAGSQRMRVRRDIKDRFESQVIQSYQVGGETKTGDWKYDYKLAYSNAREHETNTTDPTRFERNVTANGALGFTFDYSDLEFTPFTVNAGAAGFNDPSLYNFSNRRDVNGVSRDEEWSAKLDVSRNFMLETGDLQIKGGAKFRIRDKAYDLNRPTYNSISGTPSYTLADVLGSQTYGLAALGPLPSLDLVRAFNSANQSRFVLNASDTFSNSLPSNYDVEENVYAGYGMAKWTSGPLTAVGGVRVEKTEDDVAAYATDAATFSAQRVEFTKGYTDWLPSLNLKYEATDEIVLRAGVFSSLVRPGIGQLAPRFTVASDDTATSGNADLDPYQALNADLSAEWYFAPDAVVQVGAFYKDIKDFIVSQTVIGAGSFNGIQYISLTKPVNGDSAKARGLEFNYQQALTFLPGPLDGMLVGFNYTYTDAEGDVGGRSIPLPASSKNTYNAMLGYENGPWSLRLTAAYRDGYLDELGGSALTDRYVKEHLQFDASAKYRINENFQLYAEFVNLNDEPYIAYQKGIDSPATGIADNVRDRLLQYETYSWTGKFGLRMTY